MEDFEESLTQALKGRPGLTRERLAAAMKVEYGDEFRERLSEACDKGIVHKILDKYYPGDRLSY